MHIKHNSGSEHFVKYLQIAVSCGISGLNLNLVETSCCVARSSYTTERDGREEPRWFGSGLACQS